MAKSYEDGRREGYELALQRMVQVAVVVDRAETQVIRQAANIVRMMGHDVGVVPTLPAGGRGATGPRARRAPPGG